MVSKMATRKKATSAPTNLGDNSSTASSDREEEFSFEDAMARLSEIVEELEGGELNLESSLKHFEEGIKLARKSQSRLDEAEAKVEELLGFEEDGTPITEEI